MGNRIANSCTTGYTEVDKEKMRVYIDISPSAFTHFSNEAKEQGVPVKTLISGEVEALYCNALEDKWREEDLEEEDLRWEDCYIPDED